MAKRPLRPDEKRLWASVARTVRPRPGVVPPEAPSEPSAAAPAAPLPAEAAPAAPTRPPRPPHYPVPVPPDPLEPNRQRRLTRERDRIDARIDLHGFGQFEAEDRLKEFLRGCHARGLRSVLVITGKGAYGAGVIRSRFPEWLADPAMREIVAGLGPAHRRHGGEGAFYVALKRRRD
ncbi:MAG TPA: Smr/MutS family protein [Caulobacteraceae bacterium]|nr:Smr/MutS family protein [Caulobacteraceae bacterium]